MIAVNQNDATMNSRRGMETTDAYTTVGESSRSTPFPAKRKLWSEDHKRQNAGQHGKSEPQKRGTDANNSNDSTNKWTQPNSRSRSRPQQRLQTSRRRTRGTTNLYLPERIPNRQYEPTGGLETIK